MEYEKGYIGVTSWEWFEFLRDSNITKNVCFWRKKESPSNSLRPGDLFFFLVKNKKQKKGERAILGYGVFQRYEVLDVEEAWKKYTLGNGSSDKSTFISRAKSLSGNKSESFELSCIILSDLHFFEEPIYPNMKGVYFKERTVSGRYIVVGEIEALLNHFPPYYDSEVGFSEDDNSFTEGRKMMRLHLVRERNHKLIGLAKENYKRIHGKLICEICRFDFEENYGIVGRDYIEGHHIVPISELCEDYETIVEDIALVCANCHRMLHRKRPWLTMSQLKRLLKKPNIEVQ